MPNNIIKDGAVVVDNWQLVSADATDIPEGKVIVPVALWSENKDSLSNREDFGIWLNSDESPELIKDELDQFKVIAINFPAFADGRGFSYGRSLRDVYRYHGEIRAIGGFMRDQLFFLKRCGFNAFALENSDLENALDSFKDFTDSYQASIDQPEPLFKRR